MGMDVEGQCGNGHRKAKERECRTRTVLCFLFGRSADLLLLYSVPCCICVYVRVCCVPFVFRALRHRFPPPLLSITCGNPFFYNHGFAVSMLCVMRGSPSVLTCCSIVLHPLFFVSPPSSLRNLCVLGKSC